MAAWTADSVLFWVLALQGVVFGLMEHRQVANCPMSKFRSEALQKAWGTVSARPAFVGVYAMALLGLLLGYSLFGELSALGTFMYFAHFSKRVLECAFVHVYSAPMDVFTVAYIGSVYLGIGCLFAWDFAQPVAATDAMRTAGLIMFLVGQATNGAHHLILRRLRTDPLKKPLLQGQKYSLPTGGLFDQVLFPHYMGEMLAWTGVALAINRGAVHGLNLSMFAHQIGRASAGRQWYVGKFGKAAVEKRGLLVPYVF